ncbi:MAG: hypothetical protein HY269_05125 [Deltaproteobacteria bacterium]|nr:hypothetical protein [Deltaproteobacteria bacterium]
MANVKCASTSKRRIWRITADAPFGEFVELDRAPPIPSKPEDARDGGRIESSYDLARGLEVRELNVSVNATLKPKAKPGS